MDLADVALAIKANIKDALKRDIALVEEIVNGNTEMENTFRA